MRSPRTLVVLAAAGTLVLGTLSAATATGTSTPQIVSPVSSVPKYAGFKGPYTVDFSRSPAGTYRYTVTSSDDVLVGDGEYQWTGADPETVNLFTATALPAGTYVFRVHETSEPSPAVPDATLSFTVRPGAQPRCSVGVPRAVRVNSGEERVLGRLATNCAAAQVTYASWEIRHVTRGLRNLMTFDRTTRDTFSFFGPDPLGTYVVTPVTAINAASDDIRQNAPRIDVRLDSRLTLSAQRAGRFVTLGSASTVFARSANRFRARPGNRVTLSSRTCRTCAWRPLITKTTGPRGRVSFRVRAPATRDYRVNAAATPTVWAPYPKFARR